MNNSIVVYRSKNEQIVDEFMHENPEYLLGFITLLIAIFVLLNIIKRK